MIKLDPVEKQSMIFEILMKTRFGEEYVNGLSNEELIKLYKDRCQNGEKSKR